MYRNDSTFLSELESDAVAFWSAVPAVGENVHQHSIHGAQTHAQLTSFDVRRRFDRSAPLPSPSMSSSSLSPSPAEPLLLRPPRFRPSSSSDSLSSESESESESGSYCTRIREPIRSQHWLDFHRDTRTCNASHASLSMSRLSSPSRSAQTTTLTDSLASSSALSAAARSSSRRPFPPLLRASNRAVAYVDGSNKLRRLTGRCESMTWISVVVGR